MHDYSPGPCLCALAVCSRLLHRLPLFTRDGPAVTPGDDGRRVQGPEVRSGDLAEPAELVPGEEWVFTINEGEKGGGRRISVNYDGFVHDVSAGDELLVDGGIMTFKIKEITATDVVCTVRIPPPLSDARRLLHARWPAVPSAAWAASGCPFLWSVSGVTANRNGQPQLLRGWSWRRGASACGVVLIHARTQPGAAHWLIDSLCRVSNAWPNR